MKKIILSLAVICSTLVGMSQKNTDSFGKTKSMPNQHHRKFPKEKLNFTAQQNEKFEAINKDFRTKMQALNMKENITVKQQRDEKAALLKKHKVDVNNLLTSEQKNTLATLKANEKKQRDERLARQLDQLKKKLNLTDEQTAKIKTNQNETHTQLEALRQNEKLERSEKMAQLNALKTKMKTDMQNVLTAEQKKQFEILRTERQQKMSKDGEKKKEKHHPTEVK